MVNFLRGYSIFTIVIMHLVGMLGISGIWEKAAAFGGAGVHVFILCSGFGLYLSYLSKPLGYIAFLKKRFTRIYMPMAVLCVATAVWMASVIPLLLSVAIAVLISVSLLFIISYLLQIFFKSISFLVMLSG